jgi:hypothetical protein
LPALNNPTLTLSIDEEKNISGSITVEPLNLTPRALRRRLTVEGGGTLNLSGGKLSGNVNAALTYNNLGNGRIDLAFNAAGELTGSGHIQVTQPYLQGVRADLAVTDSNVNADVNIPAGSITTPIPGMQIAEGNVHLTYHNGTPGGALENVVLRYPGLGDATLNATIQQGLFSGGGDFNITVSQLTDVSGRLRYQNGRLSGSATIRSQDFPDALPVNSGNITATLAADGAVSFRGEVSVTLGPAGSGMLRAAYQDGNLNIGCTIDLNVPGLQGARFTIDYINGNLEGEGDVPIDTELLQGVGGSVHVEYREGRWAGETELTYDADNGKLHGTVRVGVQQNEQDGLNVYGGGDVNARIAPRLEGTLGLNINPDGTIDISGAITVTEPLELFPEKRWDRELFRYSQNIPLWAILVAVIRVRAGVRAGIGAGVFRDIRVEGEYTIGGEAEPSLSITGEMYIPAFVEAYVAFGAGLGLDVVLGSLTGGIEAMASAGIYGAVSVVPELAYENGDYRIEGTATLAAGARLKVGLNAWAEIEALWVTVWEQTWELAEWVWNIGPDLALQARMSYVFGHPEPPNIEFSTDDIDTDRLIQDALPKDGPGPSGAREAVQNRAEWQGATRRQGRAANTVPSEQQQQRAAAPTPAPPAPPRHPRRSPPSGRAAAQEDASRRSTGGTQRQIDSAADAAQRPTGGQRTALPSEVPGADQPRYPRPVTLEALNQPPVPMPRTAHQAREDLEAAGRVLALAKARVRTTEELEAYFPRIRNRFQLTRIGFVTEGRETQVHLAVNPTLKIDAEHELIQGRGIAGKKSGVTYRSGQLVGNVVGLEMIADPLGPDHPQGQEPTGDNVWSRLLVTDPKESNDKKYIRGHLLNHQVGGEGAGRNLFPITATANDRHESQIESRVKQWVNTDRYWVYYKVTVAEDNISINPARPIATNKADARFICEASVYDLGGGKHNTIRATIVSRYQPPAGFKAVQGASGPDRDQETAVQSRPEDKAADIALPPGAEYRLDAGLHADLARIRHERGLGTRHIDEVVQEVTGLGTNRITSLHKAFHLTVEHGGVGTDIAAYLNSQEKDALTRINRMAGAIRAELAKWL